MKSPHRNLSLSLFRIYARKLRNCFDNSAVSSGSIGGSRVSMEGNDDEMASGSHRQQKFENGIGDEEEINPEQNQKHHNLTPLQLIPPQFLDLYASYINNVLKENQKWHQKTTGDVEKMEEMQHDDTRLGEEDSPLLQQRPRRDEDSNSSSRAASGENQTYTAASDTSPSHEQLQLLLKAIFKNPDSFPQVISGIVDCAVKDIREHNIEVKSIKEEVFETKQEQPSATNSEGGDSTAHRATESTVKPEYALQYGFKALKEWNEWIESQKKQTKSIKHSICRTWNGTISVCMSSQKPVRISTSSEMMFSPKGFSLAASRGQGSNLAQYTFPYTVKIRNNTDRMIQVLSRFWRISFDNGKSTVVEGLGLVGCQPVIRPGGEFQYQSYVPSTHGGQIEGYLQIQEVQEDKDEWEKIRMQIQPVRFNMKKPEKLKTREVERRVKFESSEDDGDSSGSGSEGGKDTL